MSEERVDSAEGDLDPDLTEEAGYAYWDPPARRWLRWVIVGATLLVVISFTGASLLAVLR